MLTGDLRKHRIMWRLDADPVLPLLEARMLLRHGAWLLDSLTNA
jgi:hypothetical protein